MLKTLVVLSACFVACHCKIDSLLPYNLTASLMFLAEDLNQDGAITIDELEAEFDQYDTNNNGMVSRHEYTEYICHAEPILYNLAHYLYDDYDMDGDHHLRKTDYDAFFHKLDKDGDGQVTPAEYIELWEGLFVKYEYVEVHSQTHAHGHSQCH